MRKFAFVAGALAFVGVCGVAQADGNRGAGAAYAPAGYNWSGVYFGAHVGGGWGDVDARESLGILFGGTSLLSGTSSHDVDGWLAGVQLGAMKQYGSFVVGTEFSLSGADISGSGRDCFGITTGTGGAIDANCHTNINWLLTGLVKAGFARDRWMAYGALGYAVAGVDHSVTVTSPFLPGLRAELLAAGYRVWRRLRGRLRLCALEGLHDWCAISARESRSRGARACCSVV